MVTPVKVDVLQTGFHRIRVLVRQLDYGQGAKGEATSRLSVGWVLVRSTGGGSEVT